MRRPLSHKYFHPHLFLGIRGPEVPVLTHSFSQFCTLPTQGTCSFSNGNLGIQAMISTSTRPYEGGPCAAASSRGWKGKGPFGHRKSRSWHWKLHCKDCVNRRPMWRGRSLRSHLSLGPVCVGCVLLGSCPHLFISSLSLHLVLPFSDFGHSTTEKLPVTVK